MITIIDIIYIICGAILAVFLIRIILKKDWKYWLKGGIIGLIIGAIWAFIASLNNLIYFVLKPITQGFYIFLVTSIPNFIGWFIMFFLNFLFNSIILFPLGVLIGFIIQKVKKTWKRRLRNILKNLR